MDAIGTKVTSLGTIYGYHFNLIYDIETAVQFLFRVSYLNDINSKTFRLFYANSSNKNSIIIETFLSEKELVRKITESNFNMIEMNFKRFNEPVYICVNLSTFNVMLVSKSNDSIEHFKLLFENLIDTIEQEDDTIFSYNSSSGKSKEKQWEDAKEFEKLFNESTMKQNSYLSDYDVLQCFDYAYKVSFEKEKEKNHQKDRNQRSKRFRTGQTGEVALGNFIGYKIADFDVGRSKRFGHPDLIKIGIPAGVKCSTYFSCPLVPIKPCCCEVICIKTSTNSSVICGVATPDVLRKYSSLAYVHDYHANTINKKIGFYGFKHLIPFKNYDELKAISEKYREK